MTVSHTGRYHEMQDQIDMKNPLDIHLQCQRSLHLGGIHDFFYISCLRYLSADVSGLDDIKLLCNMHSDKMNIKKSNKQTLNRSTDR